MLSFLSAPILKEIQLVLFELRLQVCLHPRSRAVVAFRLGFGLGKNGSDRIGQSCQIQRPALLQTREISRLPEGHGTPRSWYLKITVPEGTRYPKAMAGGVRDYLEAWETIWRCGRLSGGVHGGLSGGVGDYLKESEPLWGEWKAAWFHTVII